MAGSCPSGRCGSVRARPLLEGLLIAAHIVAYPALVLAVMSPGKAVAFIVVHQLVFGLYIGLSFAPNHKGMPIQRPDEDWDWLTSRRMGTSPPIRRRADRRDPARGGRRTGPAGRGRRLALWAEPSGALRHWHTIYV